MANSTQHDRTANATSPNVYDTVDNHNRPHGQKTTRQQAEQQQQKNLTIQNNTNKQHGKKPTNAEPISRPQQPRQPQQPQTKPNYPIARVIPKHIKMTYLNTQMRDERMEAKLKFLLLDNGKKVSLQECTPEELVKAINDVANELAKRAIKNK